MSERQLINYLLLALVAAFLTLLGVVILSILGGVVEV